MREFIIYGRKVKPIVRGGLLLYRLVCTGVEYRRVEGIKLALVFPHLMKGST